LLEALSFFLVRVPEREAEDDKPERPAATIFPRYHQSRLVRRVAEDITAHFAAAGDIGKKYLADHSAGSGKTLSICWLADRLHSLFKPGTNDKLVDITFILTDRKSLDTNIREDIDKFTHLKDVVGIAKKADDLPRFLQERKSIIVTTQQKFAWVLDELQKNPKLKNLRVAFLIDEAHRSQEGQMDAAIRLPFRKADEPDEETADQDLEGPCRGQVNGEIQTTYDERGRYNELTDPKYSETGGIFDIMAVTVTQRYRDHRATQGGRRDCRHRSARSHYFQPDGLLQLPGGRGAVAVGFHSCRAVSAGASSGPQARSRARRVENSG
jgi:hypothetical protein